jgi:hypothetical protein
VQLFVGQEQLSRTNRRHAKIAEAAAGLEDGRNSQRQDGLITIFETPKACRCVS